MASPPSFIGAVPSAAVPAPTATGRADRIAGLREIARRLRVAPDDEKTLQYVIDQACACTGASAGVITLHIPAERHVHCGAALGAGGRMHAPLRADGVVVGLLELTRMAGADPFDAEDESFIELVADYLARSTLGAHEGTALDPATREFVNSVTEELRSPLATVSGLLDVILRGGAGPVADQQSTYLRMAAEHNQRLMTLSEDLLTLARLRVPRPREMDVLAVGPWLAPIVEARRDDAEAQDLTLTLTTSEEPLLVRAVPPLLSRVAYHMLDNAIKFSQPGGSIVVVAERWANVARITVRDKGIGFDSSDAARIFGRFARAATAETARIPGAGLGLALVHEIAEVHGGRAWAESVKGEGTEVHVTLPIAT
jgi:two-component system, OmpR family, phosphate regulon sensor histidine kinase PhoR